MYVPTSNQMRDDAEVRAFVQDVGAADLVTVGDDGVPVATFVPIVWSGDRVVAHVARANPHWKQIADGAPALLVVRGAHGYVSPRWYAAKAEHGRVVPTWNYSAVHLTGTARVFHDAARLRAVVELLTDAHEAGREEPWQVEDAPPRFIDGMLRAIVGIEVRVDRVDGKAKLSQNRSAADREGVVAGLLAGDDRRGEHQMAVEMARALRSGDA